MDTEDESWLDSHKSIYGDLDSDPVRFENMVDKLEKGSGHLVGGAFFKRLESGESRSAINFA